MFDFDCPRCGRTLIFPGQIHEVVNDEHGIVVVFECWCGELAAWRTGRGCGQRRRYEVVAAG